MLCSRLTRSKRLHHCEHICIWTSEFLAKVYRNLVQFDHLGALVKSTSAGRVQVCRCAYRQDLSTLRGCQILNVPPQTTRGPAVTDGHLLNLLRGTAV
jgi:hypothetical protein